jgi:hypothetical protein
MANPQNGGRSCRYIDLNAPCDFNQKKGKRIGMKNSTEALKETYFLERKSQDEIQRDKRFTCTVHLN